MERERKCPALGGPHKHTAVGTMLNQHWWPNQLNLKILHQNSTSPILWARTSTTLKSSRASTWMP